MKSTENIHGNRDFPEIEISYSRSKEAVWEAISQQIDQKAARPAKSVGKLIILRSVAALFLGLLTLTAILRFYTKTIECPSGEQLTATLPDGSSVKLNAASTLSYHPGWWNFARQVKFEGEGFFQVERGSRFEVESANGTTAVLGTSFNIFSRDEEYEVTCFTGKVQVGTLKTGQHTILSANEQAKINKGKIERTLTNNTGQVIAWTQNMFSFTAEPIQLVIKEIERQYDIQIHFENQEDLNYTGNFPRNQSVEEVLALVCLPMQLTFEKLPNKGFIVRKIE